MVLRIHAAHAHEVVPADAQLSRILTHVLAEERLVEIVMACRHRSVNCVERRSANHLKSLVEREATLHIVHQALNIAQRSMTLIAVVDILLDTQLLQREHTTDTQQNLLLQAVLPVATIERVSNRAVELTVHLVVSVKQIELHTTHIHTPHISVHRIVVVRNIHHQRLTVLVKLALERKLTKVLSLILSHLLTIHRQRLSEIAEAIQETNSHHVNIRVRSLLHVVTGQDAKTTRINLQHVAQTILHAQVSHRWTSLVRLNIHIFTEFLIKLIHALHNVRVLSQFLKFLVVHSLQEQHRVLLHLLPKVRIKILIKVSRIIVPRPPHVVCNFIQRLKSFWNVTSHANLPPVGIISIACLNFHN